ncbi:MAG: DNA methyltransferase [Bacillota bacterium]|nr:DNA methyltransferase [Bacillota bacterium]MDW7683736.1 DNA methyltransferase [Bacillota bacterium]
MTNYVDTDSLRIEGEFWTAKQRQMHSLHYTISYRASFKPEMPDYFIRRYSSPGDVVADPFCGRGTTALQANLLGRSAWTNDVNPLAAAITYAKTNPVSLDSVNSFLNRINWEKDFPLPRHDELLSFYHPRTLKELYLLRKQILQAPDDTARFVQLLVLSRLHGHSKGFFSAYSMPQISITPQAQQRINSKRGETPEYRALAPRIAAKAKAALRDGQLDGIRSASIHNRYLNTDARQLSWPDARVDLIITSPPFLNKVNYLADNWLEHWFLDIDTRRLKLDLMQTASLSVWSDFMRQSIFEMARILRSSGICVIEVGDVCHRGHRINLDEIVCQIISENPQTGLKPRCVLIQNQEFTKLAHCFSVKNNKLGTNTQRMLVLEKD